MYANPFKPQSVPQEFFTFQFPFASQPTISTPWLSILELTVVLQAQTPLVQLINPASAQIRAPTAPFTSKFRTAEQLPVILEQAAQVTAVDNLVKPAVAEQLSVLGLLLAVVNVAAAYGAFCYKMAPLVVFMRFKASFINPPEQVSLTPVHQSTCSSERSYLVWLEQAK